MEAIEQLRTLAAIAKGNFAPSGEADTAEAVKLNHNAPKPTLYALDNYSALFPRVEFNGSNGRLRAGMKAGYVMSEMDVQIIG